jgi:hypothetical protein
MERTKMAHCVLQLNSARLAMFQARRADFGLSRPTTEAHSVSTLIRRQRLHLGDARVNSATIVPGQCEAQCLGCFCSARCGYPRTRDVK